MKRITFLLLAVALILSACTTPGGSNSSSPAGTAGNVRVVVRDGDASDPQIVEVLNGNNRVFRWRQSMQVFLNAGNKVDIFIDCDDGRCSAGAQQYAVFTAEGQAEPFRFEIGSLAGEVTPEMIQVFNNLIDQGRVRSIVISTHTCEGGTCGAQGVKGELESGKSVADFASHGVGDAAQWIQDNLDSSHPIEQVGAQVARVFEGTGGRVPVLGFVTDHLTQTKELVANRFTGAAGEDLIVTELQLQNQESARILGPKAAEMGLDKAQSFRRIVVTDSLLPVEVLVGTTPGGLDEAFNVSLIVPQGASVDQIASAMGPARAGLQYALAHAGPETEVLFMFESDYLLELMLEEAGRMQVYKDFLSNTTFQEVAAYRLKPDGTIFSSYLVKPAYTVVSLDLLVGPFFRGAQILAKDGDWVLFRGDPQSLTDDSIWFKMDGLGVVTWKYEGNPRRMQVRYDATRIYAEANGITTDGITLDTSDPTTAVLEVPDWGDQFYNHFRFGTDQSAVDSAANQGIDSMMRAYPAVAIPYDAGAKQYVTGGQYGTLMVDWEDALLGESAVRAVFPTAESYYQFLTESFAAGWRSNATWESPAITNITWQLPKFTDPASGFAAAGASEYVSSDIAMAFEKALADLKSASPETVAAARNTLRAMGAVEYQGQWLIGGSRSVLASGPIRLSTLQTMYPDGAKAFVGFQTPRGVFGFERAENVLGGVGGWRVYSTWLSGNAATLEQFALVAGKAVAVVWAGFVANDVVQFSGQTEYIMATSSQMLQPPTTSSTYMWFPNEKTPYVTTRWEIPLGELQSGCNGTGLASDGCGAYLPDGQRSPIALVGALAGEYLQQTTWPSFGLDGNNALLTWEYMKEGGSFSVWHNGQLVMPGESLDYYEAVITQDGMWLVPYHAEFQTGTCTGLCIQQSHGGEELRFLDGAQPVALDLCPLDVATGTDPCLWRP